MGRPLNKKYFGNRNIGTNGYEGVIMDSGDTPPHNAGETTTFYADGDDGIGGEGVQGIQTITDQGSYLDRIPDVTFKAPSLPGGVTATGYVSRVEALTAVPHDKGIGYQIGDIIELDGGTGGVAAQFRVTQLRVVDIQLVEGASSSQFDGGENLAWDTLVDSHWTTPTVIYNISSTGNPNYDISGWQSWDGGVWDGGPNRDPAPTGNITITGGGDGHNTRGAGDTYGGVGDNNGAGGTVTFTYGIEAVELVQGGSYTAIPVVGAEASVINITEGASGGNATFDVYYGVDQVTMTEKGSGYINAADALPEFTEADPETSEIQATATAYLTYDQYDNGTGYKQGNAANQENAIIAYIWNDGERRIADIVKQTGSKRFVCITNEDGPGSGKEDETVYGYLVGHDAERAYEIDIGATDANGNTYYVTKIENHKAVLNRRTQSETAEWLFDDGDRVEWTFSDMGDFNPDQVRIDNA